MYIYYAYFESDYYCFVNRVTNSYVAKGQSGIISISLSSMGKIMLEFS
jgi:hypothetical protein